MSSPAKAPWTADDVADLLRLGPRRFSDEHPERSYDSARLKHGKLRREGVSPTTLAGGAKQSVTPAATADDFDAYVRMLEAADELKQSLSPTQDSTTVAAPDPSLCYLIAFTGDWHCGASGVQYKRLRDDLALLRDTPGCYLIGMGDFVEGVSTHSKAAPALYSGLFNEPMLQERYVEERVDDAKGSWLALMEGNHDGWAYQHAGVRRIERIATSRGIPYFPQGGGTVFFHIGDVRYVIAVRHNAPGNSRLNTTNSQRTLFNAWPEWENCDVICLAHFHHNDLHVAPRKGGRCVYLRSGTYKTSDSYARDGGFVPEWGVPLAILYPGEKRVVPFRGDDMEAGLRFYLSERGRYEKTLR